MVKFGVRFEEGSASRHWQSSHVAYGALKKVLKRASQASGRPVGRSNYGPPGRGLAHLPDGLGVDRHEGKAYVGCMPFVMEKVRPAGLPAVPGVSTFGEFNIRTYVVKNGIPGVFFLTLDAKSRVTCFYANRKYGLAYRYAKASVKGTLATGYAWDSIRSSNGVGLSGSSKATSTVRQAEEGTLEYFLFERYSLYTEHKNRLRHGYTHHVKWWYADAEATIQSNTLVESYNLGIADAKAPHMVHMAEGVEVVTWHLLPMEDEPHE